MLNGSIKETVSHLQSNVNFKDMINNKNVSTSYSGRVYSFLAALALTSFILCVVGKVFNRSKNKVNNTNTNREIIPTDRKQSNNDELKSLTQTPKVPITSQVNKMIAERNKSKSKEDN